MDRTYICIDLKSYYASVEAVSRGYDPLKCNYGYALSRHFTKVPEPKKADLLRDQLYYIHIHAVVGTKLGLDDQPVVLIPVYAM